MTQISAPDNCMEVKNFPEIAVMAKRPSLSKKEKDKTAILSELYSIIIEFLKNNMESSILFNN